MKLLVVTPIHNERNNIGVLADQLARSSVQPDVWVVVDDGSSDGGAEVVREKDLPFVVAIIQRQNAGRLIGGSAFTAWHAGVDHGINLVPDYTHVMKLDADVDLPSDYLAKALGLFASQEGSVGLVGGVLASKGNREQVLHVPGPVKLYSRAGFDALSDVPRAVGFDVLDEVAIKAAGLRVRVDTMLSFDVRRPIGASQGLVHGRRRNGVVCRWTGYWPPYFFLHVLRYVFRRPFVVGSVAMVFGYLRAGDGPYPEDLRRLHAEEQVAKLAAAMRAPISWYRRAYGR